MDSTRESGHAKGDLGRRVAQRRWELGLSQEEVAERAGMAAGYVAYLEEHPPLLNREALHRLANALRTSPDQLLGGETDAPPGSATAVPAPELRELTAEECMELVGPGGVGRIAFLAEGETAPAVLPVNYAVVEAAIVFRTLEHGVIATHAPDDVTFEVDRLDGAMSEGWSVLITGRLRRVGDEAELAAIREATALRSWAGGQRDTYMRITPTGVSGRRIESAAPHSHSDMVR